MRYLYATHRITRFQTNAQLERAIWRASSRRADNNQFSFNIFKVNAENGVLIGDSQANTFCFTNFLAEKSNFYAQEGNNINFTTRLNYPFSGNSFSGFVGNYYTNYLGSDVDRYGIGETPFD